MAVLVVMAVLMFAVPLPEKDERLHGYMLSRQFLAISYILLAVYCYFKSLIPLELFSPPFLFMANLQANLLALSHLNLVNPRMVQKKYVFLHFIPMIVCSVLYGVVLIFVPHVSLVSYSSVGVNISSPEVIARLLWMLEYVVMCVYYVIMFVREDNRWREEAANFYADDSVINISTIRQSFVLVSCIGVVTLVVSMNVLPALSTICNLLFLVLYIVTGILFLKYPHIFTRMQQLLYETDFAINTQSDTRKWRMLRAEIVRRRMFCQSGITMQQMARSLSISRTALSTSINRYEGMNFNSFINMLRVREAQRMMRDNPELNFQEISDRVGFNSQSSFSRHFRLYASCTPSEWHQKFC